MLSRRVYTGSANVAVRALEDVAADTSASPAARAQAARHLADLARIGDSVDAMVAWSMPDSPETHRARGAAGDGRRREPTVSELENMLRQTREHMDALRGAIQDSATIEGETESPDDLIDI